MRGSPETCWLLPSQILQLTHDVRQDLYCASVVDDSSGKKRESRIDHQDNHQTILFHLKVYLVNLLDPLASRGVGGSVIG